MSMKIVLDSSSNICHLADEITTTVPLKIRMGETEFVDELGLDVADMVSKMESYPGKTSTTCPNPHDWVEAFDNAEYVFAVTISSNLSGSYNSALAAKHLYEEEYPDRKVFVIDSLSTGAEMCFINDKLRELMAQGKSFEEICDAIVEYQKHVHLIFTLKSMQNLVKNGRVSKAVALIAGALNILVIGVASPEGTISLADKVRGEAKSVGAMINRLKALGYKGKRIRIDHTLNENLAIRLKDALIREFGDIQVEISENGGLCSFYAERGGLIIGFEVD